MRHPSFVVSNRRKPPSAANYFLSLAAGAAGAAGVVLLVAGATALPSVFLGAAVSELQPRVQTAKLNANMPAKNFFIFRILF